MVALQRYVNLWEIKYDKMTDEEKNMLPLRRIAIFGTNDKNLAQLLLK
ncbi:MAG: hypothetical protein KBT13_01185 [Bacteroidales bacterium]|nr:hypothetical protein [Candidatus Sodaliphilus limicaballi]